ncbi:hypothetical protein FA13DRAFT_1325343 [Coprinellus micaceus]|uniref:Uncharacterized protein n=1 Tax=Coprinellus micaceus TaxID=71717 RepID=A0A4Y7SR32_COPMI|nr:hypothetical protein FA13DRAFT_1325343 [Coprinellus micaceus]
MHRPAKTRPKSNLTLEDYVLLGRPDEVSTSEIQKVYRELTLKRCTLPIIQLALSGLKADLLPEYAGESYDEEATEERAFRCILLLFKCALACSTNPQLQADAKDPVIAAADGVCGWINYSMTTRGLQIYHSDGEDIRNLQEAAFHQCNTIRAILGIHPSIVEAFLETRDFLPVVYWMWTMMDPKA